MRNPVCACTLYTLSVPTAVASRIIPYVFGICRPTTRTSKGLGRGSLELERYTQ